MVYVLVIMPLLHHPYTIHSSIRALMDIEVHVIVYWMVHKYSDYLSLIAILYAYRVAYLSIVIPSYAVYSTVGCIYGLSVCIPLLIDSRVTLKVTLLSTSA